MQWSGYDKIMPKKKRILPANLSNARILPWHKLVPASVLPLEKGAKAGVVVNREGTPRMFVFETHALLDVLSA